MSYSRLPSLGLGRNTGICMQIVLPSTRSLCAHIRPHPVTMKLDDPPTMAQTQSRALLGRLCGKEWIEY